jgi:hypothetical protein
MEARQAGGGNAGPAPAQPPQVSTFGTDDGVLQDTAAAGQPVRLGVQIGADAAAFGGIEHRDIDKVHARFRSNSGQMRPTIAADPAALFAYRQP